MSGAIGHIEWLPYFLVPCVLSWFIISAGTCLVDRGDKHDQNQSERNNQSGQQYVRVGPGGANGSDPNWVVDELKPPHAFLK